MQLLFAFFENRAAMPAHLFEARFASLFGVGISHFHASVEQQPSKALQQKKTSKNTAMNLSYVDFSA